MLGRWASVAVAVLALSGCGDDEHANEDRPPTSINVTAAIADGRIHVSPRTFGAGPVRLIVSNQTAAEQELTFETGGDASGITQTTVPITPSGTATLAVDVPEGQYEIRTADDAIRPTAVSVRAPRPSAQNDLLLP